MDGESEHENVIDLKQPNLSIVRLTGDEVEFRPIPLVGAMAETSSAAVLASVGVRQSGPYNSFTLTAESAGQEFVVRIAFCTSIPSFFQKACIASITQTKPYDP